MAVVLETTIGEITIDLLTKERPRTCMNFLKLCKMKYYNHHLIYSIERDFIAQMGDPTGTGKGGESIYRFTHGDQARFYEGEKQPILKHINRGTISMVSCGNMLYGSQFFITLGDNLNSLDEDHLVFGEVVEGMEVISKLNQTLMDESRRPFKDIRITHMVVLCDPFPDPEGLEFPELSPRPTAEMFESNYIHADENLDEDNDKSTAEMDEEIAAKEAAARATILEMVGDIPDADMAPPENVLFVCKLNPVTTSEDLEIIFSRFGKIECVEVIRDKASGNSLQYAFVEFADAKSCEDAYFKMDNVLIDDRRIHVDFSQSVSKIQWKGKGRVEYFDDKGKKVSGPGTKDNKDSRRRRSRTPKSRDRKENANTDQRTNKYNRQENDKYSRRDFENRRDEERNRKFHNDRYDNSRMKDRNNSNRNGRDDSYQHRRDYDSRRRPSPHNSNRNLSNRSNYQTRDREYYRHQEHSQVENRSYDERPTRVHGKSFKEKTSDRHETYKQKKSKEMTASSSDEESSSESSDSEDSSSGSSSSTERQRKKKKKSLSSKERQKLIKKLKKDIKSKKHKK